jgi:CheY-like chemotaxis protein
VLLDVTMPVMGGGEAIAHLKRIRPDVPVIASSGYSEMEASRRFEPQHLAGFIQKPYTAADLAAKVKAVLSARAAGLGV